MKITQYAQLKGGKLNIIKLSLSVKLGITMTVLVIVMSDSLCQSGLSVYLGGRKSLFDTPVKIMELNDSLIVESPSFQEPRILVEFGYGHKLTNFLSLNPKIGLSKDRPKFFLTKYSKGMFLPLWTGLIHFKFWQISVPLNLQLRIRKNLNVSFGPQVNFHISQENGSRTEDCMKKGYRFVEACDFYKASKTSLRTVNWLFNYGITVNYNRFLFNYRHSLALQSFFKDIQLYGDLKIIPLKINIISFTLGYILLKKRIINPYTNG